jgi:hypothetical protein
MCEDVRDNELIDDDDDVFCVQADKYKMQKTQWNDEPSSRFINHYLTAMIHVQPDHSAAHHRQTPSLLHAHANPFSFFHASLVHRIWFRSRCFIPAWLSPSGS